MESHYKIINITETFSFFQIFSLDCQNNKTKTKRKRTFLEAPKTTQFSLLGEHEMMSKMEENEEEKIKIKMFGYYYAKINRVTPKIIYRQIRPPSPTPRISASIAENCLRMRGMG